MTTTSFIFTSLGTTFSTCADAITDEQLKVPAFSIARGLEDVKERVVWKFMSIVIATSEGVRAPGPENIGTVTMNPVSTPVLLGVMIQVRKKLVPS